MNLSGSRGRIEIIRDSGAISRVNRTNREMVKGKTGADKVDSARSPTTNRAKSKSNIYCS